MNTQRSSLSGHLLVQLVSVLHFMSLSKCLLVLICIYRFKLIASLTHIVYQTELKQYDDLQLAIKILQLMLRYPLLTFTTTFSIRKNILPNRLFIYLFIYYRSNIQSETGSEVITVTSKPKDSAFQVLLSPQSQKVLLSHCGVCMFSSSYSTSTVQRHARCLGFLPTLTSPTQLCGGQL